jgi:hypothetical protein
MLLHQRIAIYDLILALGYIGLAISIHPGLAAFSLLLLISSHHLYRSRSWSLDFTLGVHGLGVIFSFLFMILSTVFLIIDKGFGVNLIKFPINQWLFIAILLVHAAAHYFPIRSLRHPEVYKTFGKKFPKSNS